MGFYAEDDLSLGSLTLTAGGRADRWVIADGFATTTSAGGTVTAQCTTCGLRAGWAGSGRAGGLWRVAAPLTLRAAAYTGIRLPTINELYRSFAVFPVTTQANPTLRNERLRGYEAGIDFTPATGLSLSATGFFNRVGDAIANVTISPDGNTRQRQNVGAIRARGLEFGLHGTRGRLTLDGSLALTDAVVEQAAAGLYSLNGKRPAQTPEFVANATLAWHPRTGWSVTGTLHHIGKAFEDDLNSANSVLPATTTLGLSAQAPLGHGASLVIRAENVTDAAVITRNQAGSIDLSVPRTVWIGVRLGG